MEHHYLRNVVTLELDAEKCTGCGMCIQVCPHAVFIRKNTKVYINDKDLCMECGACSKNCPFSAIKVRTGTGCAYGLIQGKLNGSDDCCCEKQ